MITMIVIKRLPIIVLFLIIAALPATAQKNLAMEKIKTTGYAPVNGLNMYYEIHGKGDMPLVLIHGGGSTIETSFSKMLPLLAANGKVIAVELQAHGRSSDRNAPESFEQDAEDVAALLAYLKIDKANFLGFSNGGTTTLQLAIKHPGIVNKIIVVAAAFRRDGFIPGFFDGMQTATIDNMPAPLKAAYIKVAPDKNHLQTMFNKDRERMVRFKDWSDDAIRSIKAPALVMMADHDVVTPEHAVKTAQLIPNAQLVILPGTHGSFIGEICSAKKDSKLPGITAALVEAFLNE